MKPPNSVDWPQGRHAAQIAPVLREQGLVQTIRSTQGRQSLRIFNLTQHHAGRVASYRMKKKKDKGRDAPEHEKGIAQRPHFVRGKSLKWLWLTTTPLRR